jgi:hypothetical protein
MPDYVAMFLAYLQQHALCDWYPEFAPYKRMAETGSLSQDKARLLFAQAQDIVENEPAYRRFIHRPPTEEEWYERGRPQIELGSLVDMPDLRFGISLVGAQHTCLFGATQAGKTIGLRNIIYKCDSMARATGRRLSTIVDDAKGGDFADVPQALGPHWRYFSVHQGVRIGTNGPRNVPPNIWINHSSTNLAARAGLKASAICIANMMRFAVAAMNPSPAEDLLWPSFRVLLDIALKAPLTLFAHKPDYAKSLTQVLEGLASQELFDTLNGLDLDRDIVGHGLSAVIDTCNMSPPWMRLLMTDTLLSQTLLGRQMAFRRTNSIDTIFVADEADVLVERRAEDSFPDGSMSPISSMLKQSREAGVAVILGCTSPESVAPQVLANIKNLIFFKVENPASTYAARLSMFLRPGAEEVFLGLDPGQCLLRTTNGWHQAVTGQFDALPPSRVERPSSFDTHPFVPGKRLHELPELEEALDKLIHEHNRSSGRQGQVVAAQGKDELPGNARKLLLAISAHPWLPLFMLWPKTGLKIAFAAQQTARKALENHKLIESADVRIGRSNIILAWLTEKGAQAAGGNPFRATGRGGIVHAHFCQWLLQWARRQGHEATIEWIVPGTNHPVDCAYRLNNEWHAFEAISECRDNLCGHLHACFLRSQAVATVTVVAAQKGHLKSLEEQVLSDADLFPFMSRIKFDVIENYMPKENPQ